MRNLFFIALVIVLIAGCKKDSEEEAPETIVTVNNYFPLSIGNYWIYERYSIDSSGNETLVDGLDSMYIDRDSIINGNQYFVLGGSNYALFSLQAGYLKLLRDSSGYIVDGKGNRLIAQNNFTDTLYNNSFIDNGTHFYDISAIMKTVDQDISVGAGMFDAIECEKKVIVFPLIPENREVRYYHDYYANGIGQLIGRVGWISSNNFNRESRLLRYHIE